MAAGAPGPRGLCLLALLLLALPAASAQEGEMRYVELTFFRERFPAGQAKAAAEAGEYLAGFEGEEIFHVDSGRSETVWRLPDFTSFSSFEAAGALGALQVVKNNLEVFMALSNRTRAQNVAPSVTVYPKDPVELGEPNVLICFVDKFSPPVLNVTWLKNGEGVSQGVQETGFYPNADHTLRKFSYLPFIPEDGDFYTCRVEHRGLPEPVNKIWHSKESTAIPETTENVLCGLGLAIGILGILTGTVLFFKALRGNDRNSRGRGSL